jgi:hypothetical protein
MTDEHHIKTIADIAALTPDQRERCVADLLAWCDFYDKMRPLVDAGVMDPITEMVWRDDGKTEVSGVLMMDRETGAPLMHVEFLHSKEST